MTEEDLQDTRHKLTTLEKKYSVVEQTAKELEETLRRTRISAIEEQTTELDKIKEHFTRLVDRVEEENRNIKEKVRTYELKVHDLEIENNSLAGRNKEL